MPNRDMAAGFYSLQMIVEERFVWCDLDDCGVCEKMRQDLYNLARENNR